MRENQETSQYIQIPTLHIKLFSIVTIIMEVSLVELVLIPVWVNNFAVRFLLERKLEFVFLFFMVLFIINFSNQILSLFGGFSTLIIFEINILIFFLRRSVSDYSNIKGEINNVIYQNYVNGHLKKSIKRFLLIKKYVYEFKVKIFYFSF